MSFKSKAQVRRLAKMVEDGEISKEKFDEWAAATPNISKLPERIHPAKNTLTAAMPKPSRPTKPPQPTKPPRLPSLPKLPKRKR